jgi:hypothetical protein
MPGRYHRNPHHGGLASIIFGAEYVLTQPGTRRIYVIIWFITLRLLSESGTKKGEQHGDADDLPRRHGAGHGRCLRRLLAGLA